VNVDAKPAIDKAEKKTAEVKTKAEKKAEASIETTKEKAAKTKTEVKGEARAKSQAAAHASDEAKEHANENSAIFGAKSETTTTTEVNADNKAVSTKGEVKSATKAKAKTSKNK
jgi:hypothetical protein